MLHLVQLLLKFWHNVLWYSTRGQLNWFCIRGDLEASLTFKKDPLDRQKFLGIFVSNRLEGHLFSYQEADVPSTSF